MTERWGARKPTRSVATDRFTWHCFDTAMSSPASSRRAATTSTRRRAITRRTWCRAWLFSPSSRLRGGFDAHAIVHMGKHGNLEWLPGGKRSHSPARAIPKRCSGPCRNVYPFIVNDAGEGTQAKRRHLGSDHRPPDAALTRAESYGPAQDLERWSTNITRPRGTIPAAEAASRARFLDLLRDIGLAQDAGIAPGDDDDLALEKLDAPPGFCDLKEMQIRDGLHYFWAVSGGRSAHRSGCGAGADQAREGAGEDSLHRAIYRGIHWLFLRASPATPTLNPSPQGGGRKGTASTIPLPLEGGVRGWGCCVRCV